MKLNATDFAEFTLRVYEHMRVTLELGPKPNQAIQLCSELVRYAERYARLQVAECNRGLNERERRTEQRLEKLLKDMCDRLKLGVTFSGDPRGHVVKIQFPDSAPNSWGRDGWGIA